MCGICGICLREREAPVDAELLGRMSDALAHRGPDGRGMHVDGRVGLGHRRLSIIDLEGGAQPLFNEDGSIAIVFNGEIYNYVELRDELARRGHRLSTRSDTETIVHLYEDSGPQCLERLNGMFAFALWDAKRQELHAARDRLGEKPFYYYADADRLLFASELKAILTDRSVPREIDYDALDGFLAYGYIAAPRTIFRHVRKLPAAHRLTWKDGRVEVARYWSPPEGVDPAPGEERYLEELRFLLEDAVRLRLRSDVPVGAFLSGGIDSGGMVALAARQLDRPLMTFSVGFGDQDFDELHLARQTASRFGTEHHEIVVRETDMDLFSRLVAHFDEPFADPSMLPTYCIAREARRWVKVCISGDAGDELFAGYSHYPQALRCARFDASPAAVLRPALAAGASVWPEHLPGKGLLERLSTTRLARYQRQVGVFDPQERRRLLRPEIRESLTFDGCDALEAWFEREDLDPLSACQRADQNSYLPEDILVKVDRTAMKTSLEVRVPFLDHRLVELVNRMPADLKIRNGVQKHILRRALRGLVPDEVMSAPKRGFGIPIRRWLRGPLAAFARERLLAPDSRSRTLLQPAAVRRVLRNHARGGRDFSERAWTLLVLEEWLRLRGD